MRVGCRGRFTLINEYTSLHFDVIHVASVTLQIASKSFRDLEADLQTSSSAKEKEEVRTCDHKPKGRQKNRS